MNKTFLKTRHILFFIFLNLVIFFFISWILAFVGVCFLIGWIFLFRKRSVQLAQKKTSADVIVSPVSSKIYKIKESKKSDFFGEGLKEIKFRVHPFQEYGLRLPAQADVDDIIIEEKKNVFIQLCLTSGQLKKRMLGLKIKPQRMGPIFKNFLQAGDRGMMAACFGLLPFGGEVSLYLPRTMNILVREGELMVAGESLIAAWEGEI